MDLEAGAINLWDHCQSLRDRADMLIARAVVIPTDNCIPIRIPNTSATDVSIPTIYYCGKLCHTTADIVALTAHLHLGASCTVWHVLRKASYLFSMLDTGYAWAG